MIGMPELLFLLGLLILIAPGVVVVAIVLWNRKKKRLHSNTPSKNVERERVG
jgi:dolichyl-phosphate-mannose--protein O-mannosyl transferase